MRIAIPFLILAFWSCTNSPMRAEKVKSKFFQAGVETGVINKYRTIFHVVESKEMESGLILHIGQDELWPIHPGAVEKRLLVGLERYRRIQILNSSKAFRLMVESRIVEPAIGEILCQALESPLLVSLAEYPQVSSKKTDLGFSVLIRSRGRYSGDFLSGEGFNSLSGRTTTFFWEGGRIVKVRQMGFPVLNEQEWTEARESLFTNYYPREIQNPRELVVRGIHWKEEMKGSIEKGERVEINGKKMWLGKFLSGWKSWEIAGLDYGIPRETIFHDLLYEVQMLGFHSTLSEVEWSVVIPQLVKHDWLTTQFDQSINVSLLRSSSEGVECLVLAKDGAKLGRAHIFWEEDHLPVYDFYYSLDSE